MGEFSKRWIFVALFNIFLLHSFVNYNAFAQEIPLIPYTYVLNSSSESQSPWSSSAQSHVDWFDYFDDLTNKSLSKFAIGYFKEFQVDLEQINTTVGVWAAFNGTVYEDEPTVSSTIENSSKESIISSFTTHDTKTTSTDTSSTSTTSLPTSTTTITSTTPQLLKHFPNIQFHTPSTTSYFDRLTLNYFTNNAKIEIFLNGSTTPEASCITDAKYLQQNISATWNNCEVPLSKGNYTEIKIEFQAVEAGAFVLIDSIKIELMGVSQPTTPTPTTTNKDNPTSTTLTSITDEDDSNVTTTVGTIISSTDLNSNANKQSMQINLSMFVFLVTWALHLH